MADDRANDILQLTNLTKAYPAVVAVDDLSLSIERGRVHGIIGENGAGKSTLMNMLSGLTAATAGSMTIDGEPFAPRSPSDAIRQGIAMIHQELNLVDELTVAENIFLGRERTRYGLIDQRHSARAALKLINRLGAQIQPSDIIGQLSIAQKQLVEIAKALSCEARLLIMDEPTAVLSEREVNALTRLIAQLKSQGVTILFISHHLDEVMALCDAITVLRDGRLVTTVEPRNTTEAELSRHMVGRDLGDLYPKRAIPSNTPAITVQNFYVENFVRGAGFTVHKGEILGLAGLVGAGRTELAQAIAGIRRFQSGTVLLGDETVRIGSNRAAIEHGIAYLSEDRKGAGLHVTLDAIENTTMVNLGAYRPWFLDQKRRRGAVEQHIQRLNAKVGSLRDPLTTLSGGNQQKIAIAKWIEREPEIFILDEPTRGIDIGAKQEIYALIHGLAAHGQAVVLISSELPELIGLCHRILIMRHGRIVSTMPGAGATEEAIMHIAAGVGDSRVT